MNVLLIIPESSGTIAKVSYNLYKALSLTDGINLFVAILDDAISPESLDFGQNVYIFNKTKYRGIRGMVAKYKFILELKSKLAVEISISTLLGCNIFNALAKRKDVTIGIFHAPVNQTKLLGLFKYSLSIISYKFFLSKLDRIIAVSETVKRDLMRFTRKNVEIIYNIHNFNEIFEKANEDIPADDEYILRKPYILYVGGLYDLKGPDRLIKAYYKLNISERYNLVFVGGDVKNSLHRYSDMVAEYGLQDSIFFLGSRSNPYSYMRRSQFLVSPSRSEGLPGVVIEALSLDKRVVCTNSSMGVFEIMEAIDEYDPELSIVLKTAYGFISPNLNDKEDFNIEKLADAMKLMIGAPQFPKVAFNKERFTSEVIINSLIGKYIK